MASVIESRKLLVPVLIALVAIDLLGLAYAFSPLGRLRGPRERDLKVLQTELDAKRKDVLPARGMDGKLKQASTEIDSFYKERLPAQYSAVSEKLGKLALENGVQIAAVKYEAKDAAVEGLRKLNIEVAISGSYMSEAKFINALERDQMFFVVDGVTLGEQQGVVRLQLKVETYLHEGAASS